MEEKKIESLAKEITAVIVVVALLIFSEILIYVTIRVVRSALEG